MEVVWKPAQPQLHVLKRTATYITYYTKTRIYSAVVDSQTQLVVFPTLLFENNVYTGPSDPLFVSGLCYNDDDIVSLTNMYCQRFRHPSLHKVVWVQYE